MDKVKLSDVCKCQSSNLKQTDIENNFGEYPVYGASGFIKDIDFFEQENECLAVVKDGAGVGRIFILPKQSSIIGTMQYLIPESNILTRYLYYSLQKIDLKKYKTGATIPHIYFKNYSNEIVKVYDLQTQQKIVEELDCLSDIIEKKKQQLVDLDNLVKSQFFEMFGNLKNTVRLGDCCDVHARIGWQSLTTKEHMQNGDFMLITGTDFKDNEINYSTCVYVSKERYEMDPHIILRNDDVLITKDGTIGKVAVVHNLPKPATLNGGVFVVRSDDRFNKEYISYVFKGPLFESYIDKSKTGATIKHLNQKYLVEFKIPIPSNEKQEKFAIFSKHIDNLKFELKQSIEETQKLFNERMQHYFGE